MVTHTQSDYSNSRAHANRALMNVALYHTHTGMSMRGRCHTRYGWAHELRMRAGAAVDITP